MNKGKWFSTPRKIALTILNVIIFGIALAIVRLSPFPPDVEYSTDPLSVDWVSMSLELLSTQARPREAGPVPTMPTKCDLILRSDKTRSSR